MKKQTTKEFEVYPGIKAKVVLEGKKLVNVKLITKVGAGYYYSVLNDAGKMAEEMFS